MTVVRNFNHDLEADWLFALWHSALSRQWYLSAADLKKRIGNSKITLAAEFDGAPVGFCSADYQPLGGAALLVMLVDPAYQRLGIGTELLHSLERLLGKYGVKSLSLGYGGSSGYFWPGVPHNQNEAWNFFAKRGWRPQEQIFDLLIDLATYITPAWVTDRVHGSGATLQFADCCSAASIIEFEERNFPKWAPVYENALRLEKHRNVLFARSRGGAVLGTVLLNCGELVSWDKALGPRCGSLAVLGVMQAVEGRGLGTALAARAVEAVKERGCSACRIDWTGLVDWYGKLGATTWSSYRTSTKQLTGKLGDRVDPLLDPSAQSKLSRHGT